MYMTHMAWERSRDSWRYRQRVNYSRPVTTSKRAKPPDHRAVPTLDAVAALAGVGRATVSRVINGHSHVSSRTRRAVERAIAELGYIPNQSARSLARQRTGTVAVIVAEPIPSNDLDETRSTALPAPFFAGILRGIAAELHAAGLSLRLLMAYDWARQLAAERVDGALLLSAHREAEATDIFDRLRLPMVRTGRPLASATVNYVDCDNRTGAKEAVAHLLQRGGRTVATIAGPQDISAGIDRLDGYRDALRAARMPEDNSLVVIGEFHEDFGRRAIVDLLARHPSLDAVFAASDAIAVGALQAIKDSGRKVPGDIAIVGFDDSPVASHTDPPLTSVHQPIEALGREMTRLLVRVIKGEITQPQATILPTRLIQRASS
jgi:DNA-binding LacI/PurR family transcriptional regulator